MIITEETALVRGEIYTLKRGDKQFTGKYIHRKYGLGPAFSGRLKGDSKDSALPLKKAIENKWEFVQ